MDKPIISVIIPVYNTVKYLRNSISSVRNQSVPDLEIILVDDGSNDGSGAVCDELEREDCRIKVLHQQNLGVSSARNAGLKEAQGEYITFFDSDDIILENTYECLLSNIEETNAEISMCGMCTKYMDGKEEHLYSTGKRYVLTGEQALEKFFKGGFFTYSVCTKLFRSYIAKGIQFDINHKINEDKYYFYQALKKAKTVVFEDVGLYFYMKRENSASTSGFRSTSFDPVYFSGEILKDIAADNSGFLLLAEYNHYKTMMDVLRQLYRNNHAVKNFSEEGLQLRRQIKAMNVKKYSKYLSLLKKIEIQLIKHCIPVYRLMLPVYDRVFK
jgi:glycosyltransferase involved in cell wall biosynthesis